MTIRSEETPPPTPIRVARHQMRTTDDTARATRRRFDPAYKRKILDEYDGLSEPGAKGALLRREGLYSSLMSDWRRQARLGQLDAGRTDTGRGGPNLAEVNRLKRENARLRAKLAKAETIVEVQGKVSALLQQAIESANVETYSSQF